MAQPDTLSLSGKTAIVTGSGRWGGLGAAIAFALARNGAAVTITYSSDGKAALAEEVVNKLRDIGAKVLAIQANVASESGAHKVVTETLQGFGVNNIDILGKAHMSLCMEINC